MSKFYSLPDAAPRLVEVDTSMLSVVAYDVDNGYPQRMRNIYNASASAKMCANLCARYLVGKGFKDTDFYHAVIGRQGKRDLTPDKLLRAISMDKSMLRSFAIHINYNALYQVDSVKYVPVENCRFGIDDEKGKIGVYKDWYNSRKFGRYRRRDNVDFIHVYDPNPAQIEQEVFECGGWDNYKGQIYYHSDDGEDYALATIDQVLDDVQAEIESAKTRRNNLKNNFQLKTIWIEKGEPQDESEQRETVEGIKKFIGNEADQVAVVFSADADLKDVPELRSIQVNVNDKLFQYTDQTARLMIYTAFGQPAILHSDYQGTNGYNEGQLPQSQAYYNSMTEPDRILFEEVFTEIFSRFKEDINPTKNYTIIPIETLTANGNTVNNS